MSLSNCVLIIFLHIVEVYFYLVWLIYHLLLALIGDLFKEELPYDSTETCIKLSFLDEGVCLSDEITRNMYYLQSLINCENSSEELIENATCELNKASLLLKGKLKTFFDLCLVAINEKEPFESDEPVNSTDLDGYWYLLAIEVEKHRAAINKFIYPPILEHPQESDTKLGPKIISKEKPKLVQLQKSNIDERNRKYMERMKKLREMRCKSGKENIK